MTDKPILFPMKRFAQGPIDDLCGVKCLESVYDYFQMPKSTQYLVKELALADQLSYMPQLLRLLSRDGFSVIANVSNPHVFDLSWRDLPASVLIDKLHSRHSFLKENKWKQVTVEYILFLKEKNQVEQSLITEKLIVEHLLKKRIVLAFVDNVIFHQRGRRFFDEKNKTYDLDDVRGGSDGHSVVINGWDRNKGFHIVDPSEIQSYGKDGQYWINPAVLIAGVYSFSGEIGIIWK